MNYRTVKKQTQKSLQGMHWRAFSLSVYSFCTAVSAAAGSYLLPAAFVRTQYSAIFNVVCQFLLLFCSLMLCFGLRQGTAAWYTAAAFGRKPSFIQPIYWLRRGRGLAAIPVYVRVAVRKTVLTLLLTLPGLAVIALGIYEYLNDTLSSVFFLTAISGGVLCVLLGAFFSCLYNQKYSMIPTLLSLPPDARSGELIRRSRAYMEGRCMRTLAFKASLLPCALCCIVPFLLPFALPHCRMRAACYYANIYKTSRLSTDLPADEQSGDQYADA
jgi:hypothetical protein